VETITELIVRIADLAEAEGRSLRAMTLRTALAIGVILLAVGAALAGVALLLFALYIGLAAWAGPAAAAAITGALALIAGGILAWLGHRMGR